MCNKDSPIEASRLSTATGVYLIKLGVTHGQPQHFNYTMSIKPACMAGGTIVHTRTQQQC